MPYTPPASQSPAASKTTTPNISRSNSYSAESAAVPPPSSPRPGLPRSLSSRQYLQKHRRSPSFSTQNGPGSASTATRTASAGDESSPKQTDQLPSVSIRQSPPVADAPIPNRAIISPPESSGSSDDEVTAERKGRQRLVNLAELQAALRRSIGQKRDGSPTRPEDIQKMISDLTLVTGGDSANSTTPPDSSNGPEQPQGSALTPEARKISHSRSNSEKAFSNPTAQVSDSPLAISDESDEDADGQKPPLLRKKSGELVKPALRPSSRRRYSSMPGTPTYSKAVHFNEDIVQVRHFLQVDRPIAVSAGSSPVEMHDSESEYPFGFGDSPGSRGTEWEAKLANFPGESYARSTQPVRVERLHLSSDEKTLVGSVAVANIAFHKLVVARFTFDYWKTTSEIVAEYDDDVKKTQANDGYDRFKFTIKLADQANLESKTLLLCVRYNVDGQEFWDNNNHANFQVDFSKKSAKAIPKSRAQGLGARPSNAIPRSRHSPPATSRPLSMPASLDDDFASTFNNTKFRFGPTDLSESGSIKLKRKSQNARPSTAPNGGGQNAAFAARYDFGASLAASLKTVDAAMGDRSGLKSATAPKGDQGYFGKPNPAKTPKMTSSPVQPAETKSGPRPDAVSSEKPPQNSVEYNELIQKYCFFGSTKPCQQSTTQTESAKQSDGINDDAESGSDSSMKNPGQCSPQQPLLCFDGANDGNVESNSHSQRAASVMARSASPVPLNGSRATSPTSFGYPYHTSGLFNESHTPRAIGV